MSKSVIRIAKPEDAEELLKIYAPYVKHTAITFEYEVPTVEEFRDRIEHILKRHPYLAASKKCPSSWIVTISPNTNIASIIPILPPAFYLFIYFLFRL